MMPDRLEVVVFLFWSKLRLRKQAMAEVRRQWAKGTSIDQDTYSVKQLTTARDLGKRVTQEAKRFPFDFSCMVQSVALMTILRRRRIPADLRIGVAKGVGGIKAHAWVVCGEEVILDSDLHEAYIPFGA